MTNLNPKPGRAGIPWRGTPWCPPAVPLPRPRRPLRLSPARSLRLPVTPENRATLRALRAAEMRAWQTSPDLGTWTGIPACAGEMRAWQTSPDSSPGAKASPTQSPAVKTQLRGLPVVAATMALAALALGAAAMLSFHLAWRWLDLFVLVRQWLD